MRKLKKDRGRNIINREQVLEAISFYCKEKNLPVEIVYWLEKTLLRWLINYFPHIQVVQSKERFSMLVKGAVPLWFDLRSNIEFIYIDIKHQKFKELLEKVTEFLMSRYPRDSHKFHKMTVEQVLKKWEDDHKRMAQRESRTIDTSEDGLEVVFRHEKLHVVKFLEGHKELPLEMARESLLMQHCLGEFDNIEKGEGGYGAYYIDLIRKGEIELYSLRDESNMPHATVALYKHEGHYWLDQIKGKQNSFPVQRYVPASVAFFNLLDVHHHYHADCLGMGVIYADETTVGIESIEDEAEQQKLIAYDASLVHKLNNPTKSTLWLASLRHPKGMEKLENTTDAMKVSILIQQPLLLHRLSFTLKIHSKNLLKKVEKYQIGSRIFNFPKLQIGRI